MATQLTDVRPSRARVRGCTQGRLQAPLLRVLAATLAAVLAWLAVLPLAGLADRFPYYGPLGAVVATAGSPAASTRGALTTVRNIVIGACLGSAAHLLGLSDIVALAAVVGVAMLLQQLPLLSSGSPWVAYSAVFALILGGDQPWVYGAAYAGLTSLGAVIGLAVTWVMPPMLLDPTGRVIDQTGDALASQLDDLAEAIDSADAPPTADDWARRRHALSPVLRELDEAMTASHDARRANWRAPRWAGRTRHQARQASLLHDTAPLVGHLALVLSHDERADRPHPPLGAPLRPPTAAVLTAWASVLRGAADGGATQEAAEAFASRLTELADHVRARARDAPDLFTAGAVIATARRGLDAVLDD